MNKAQMQFNWIFITIAGALILVFFFGFALRYQNLQEEKLAIDLLNNLDNTLTSFQSSSFKIFDTINLPKNINIECGNIIINKKEYETNNLIFSPSNLKNKMLIWFQPYKLPFKITNFYYIIDDTSRFSLIPYNNQESHELVSEVIAKMPEQFRNKVTTMQQQGKTIRFLQGSNLDEGKVKIGETIYFYFGLPQLYAIIFSEKYDCLEEKINLEIENTINIYEKKALLLNIKAGNCNYNVIQQQLSSLKNNLNFNTINSIENLNQNLAGQNCPTLF